MHRNFVISGSPEVLRELAASLTPVAEIITLSLDEDASIKPRGAVLNVPALNRSADEVLRRTATAAKEGSVVVAIGSSSSLIDVQRQTLIALVLIPTASVAGCAMVAGRWAIARNAGWVMLVDACAIVAAGFAVFWLKQKTAHRRRPLA